MNSQQPGLEPLHNLYHNKNNNNSNNNKNIMKDRIASAFLSVVPHEPVLVFNTDFDAQTFRTHCGTARIYPDHPKWVFLPMPKGLLHVRTAQRGDVAFQFESAEAAKAWNAAIKDVGTIHQALPQRPDWNQAVYLGWPLRQ